MIADSALCSCGHFVDVACAGKKATAPMALLPAWPSEFLDRADVPCLPAKNFGFCGTSDRPGRQVDHVGLTKSVGSIELKTRCKWQRFSLRLRDYGIPHHWAIAT